MWGITISVFDCFCDSYFLMLAHECFCADICSIAHPQQRTWELQSVAGPALQRQTVVEQMIYSTCQHSRCSSRRLQSFSPSRSLLSHTVTLRRQKAQWQLYLHQSILNINREGSNVYMSGHILSMLGFWIQKLFVRMAYSVHTASIFFFMNILVDAMTFDNMFLWLWQTKNVSDFILCCFIHFSVILHKLFQI